ncbi:hypothetical protein SBY92_004965 [Candida maltosa Xu316]
MFDRSRSTNRYYQVETLWLC